MFFLRLTAVFFNVSCIVVVHVLLITYISHISMIYEELNHFLNAYHSTENIVCLKCKQTANTVRCTQGWSLQQYLSTLYNIVNA